jgi:hypothetical protein
MNFQAIVKQEDQRLRFNPSVSLLSAALDGPLRYDFSDEVKACHGHAFTLIESVRVFSLDS